MRSPTRFVALTAGLAVAVALLPVDVFAQRGGRGGGGGGGRGGGGGAVARGPSGGGGGGARPAGGPSRGGPSGGSSASARSPYYRGGSNGQASRPNGSYGRPSNGYYGRPGYGSARYGQGHAYYRPYHGHGYYRPYYGGYYRPYYGYGYYGYYGYPYWGVGLSWGYPYWGAYAWGYPYAWGGYWGGYSGGGYDPGDYQGGARLDVKPRQTEVFVDGYYAGVVDNFDGFSQKLKLEPGEHEVTLFLEGYRPLTRRMLFTAGQTIKVEHQMEPLGAGEPPAQRPVPTARPQQQAPARTRYIQPGMQRQVSGRPDDPSVDPGTRSGDQHVGDITIIEPSESRPRTENPASAGEPRGPSGTLAIRVQPDDAEVVIDGEPWARSGGERLVVALAPGVHRLEVRKSGHETYVGLVRIRPGVATTLNVALATVETR